MSAISDNEVDNSNENDADESEFSHWKKLVKKSWATRSDWRKKAKECFDMVAGKQWSEEDKKILKDQNRPAVTFDRISPLIKAVCGLEVNNRQGIIYLPRTEAGNGPDEIRSQAATYLRDQCKAEFEESRAFRDNVICGEGWTETKKEYDEDPEGKFCEERIYPLEMGVIGVTGRINHAGSRGVYRVKDMDTLEARDMFPEYLPKAIDCRWLADDITPQDGGTGYKRDYPDETRPGVTSARGSLARVRVVQLQWWDRENYHMVVQSGDNNLQEMSTEEFATYEDRIKQMNEVGQQQAADAGQTHEPITYDHVKLPRKVYYEAFLGNEGFLKDSGGTAERKLPMKQFTFKCMTADYDETDKMFYGLVQSLIDPQRWANKWLSQSMHIMNTNAKGGIIAEKTAFANVREAEQDWADNTKIVWVKDGKLDKVKDRNPPPFPQGLEQLLTFAVGSLHDVSGINLELLGQADREQAAALEAQRKQSAMTILATIFDSLKNYREDQGKLTLYFVEMMPDNTLIRIIDKGQYKYIPLVKDKNNLKYDVIVDDAPVSPNQKQLQWTVILQLLQSGIQFPPPVLFKLLKYSPLAESVVQEVQDAAGMGTQMPPEMLQQKLQQAEQALKVMEDHLTQAMQENQSEEDQKTLDAMKLAIDEYRAETDRLAAQWKAGLGLSDALMDAAATPTPGEGVMHGILTNHAQALSGARAQQAFPAPVAPTQQV